MPRPGSRARKHQGWDTCKDSQGNNMCTSWVDERCWEAILAHMPAACQANPQASFPRRPRRMLQSRRHDLPKACYPVAAGFKHTDNAVQTPTS